MSRSPPAVCLSSCYPLVILFSQPEFPKTCPWLYSLGYFVQKNVLFENPDKQKLVATTGSSDEAKNGLKTKISFSSIDSLTKSLTHPLTGFGEMRVSITVGKDELNNFIDVQKTKLHLKKEKFKLWLACFSVGVIGKAGELICFYI